VRSLPTVHAATQAAAFAIALVVAISLLAPMRAIAGERFPYRSEAGRFSVDLPAQTPSLSDLKGSKFSITDNDARYTVFAEGAEFAVEIHDIPRVAEFLLSSEYVLGRSVKGMLEDIGAREVDHADLSVQGQPAREVEFEIPDRAFKGRLLLVLAGRRLYLVSVRHPETIPPPGAASSFFESFSFWLE
jgi:hypothetical protein